MKIRFIVSALLALPLLLTACGGPPQTVTPPPTEAVTVPTHTSAPAITETVAPVPVSGDARVSITGFAFDTRELTVKVGATVTWENQDGAPHKIVADDGSFASGNLGNGDTFSFTFDAPGTFPYQCGIHASMKGTITVVP